MTTDRANAPDINTPAEQRAARRERIRAEVATWPALTEEQLGELAVLLRPAALELRRRRMTAATRPSRAAEDQP